MRIYKKVTETNRRKAFTLAEVLITLVIIGIVAAITIPSLIVKLDKVVKENQIKVFESKLQKGMDRMNLAGEIGPYYQTTEDFIKALSAHMRIVTICKAGELENCFPYESIQVQGLDEPVKVKEIDSGKSFGLNDAGYKDVAGMVLADGTPMLLTWNTECPVSDPDSSTRGGSKFGDNAGISTTSCIKGIYDINGTRGPNLMLKDVLGYGGVATLKGGGVKIAGVKISKAIKLADLQPMNNICSSQDWREGSYAREFSQEFLDEYPMFADHPCCSPNYYVSGVIECGGFDKVASKEQIESIIPTLYTGNTYNESSEGAKLFSSIGLDSVSYFYLLTNATEYDNNGWGAGVNGCMILKPDKNMNVGCNKFMFQNSSMFNGGRVPVMLCVE